MFFDILFEIRQLLLKILQTVLQRFCSFFKFLLNVFEIFANFFQNFG